MYKRLFIAAAAVALLSSCYYIPAGGSAGASVKLARSLGSNVGEITLTVSGPGMTPITQTFTADSSGTTVQVPSGVARTFTVTASTPSATLSGSATTDLSPGETKTVSIDPVLSSVKLVIPDRYDYKIIQVDDMTGAGWSGFDDLNMGLASTPPTSAMEPVKTDFDDQGRMYVANSNGSTFEIGSLFRVADVSSPASIEPLVTGESLTGLVIDRSAGRAYYTSSLYPRISWIDLSNTAAAPGYYDLTTEPQIGTSNVLHSIAMDDAGIFYFLDMNGYLYSYNPALASGSRVVATYKGFTQPMDVMVKGGYVYVADFGDVAVPGFGGVVRLSKALVFVDEFKGLPSDPLNAPSYFIETLDKRIIVLDENVFGIYDRIVSFTDMTGAGWMTYGSAADAIRGFDPIT